MSRARHTEGPWTAHKLPCGTWSIDSERCDGIAEVDNRVEWRPMRSESGEAMRARVEHDARLIAAAPELLAALEALVGNPENCLLFEGNLECRIYSSADAVQEALRVIAKAKGVLS